MKPRSLKFVLCVSLSALSTAAMSGCSKLDTGAHAEPSVSIKLSGSATDKAGTAEATGSGVAASAGGPGSFSGQVIFKGSIPAAKALFAPGKATKDPEVCAFKDAIPDESLLVSKDGGIANVFVYLDKAPAGAKVAPATGAFSFDQKNCLFTSHASISRVGQPFKVLNDDALIHNTHTFPNTNTSENLGVKPKEREGVEIKFTKAEREPFQIKCDFHSWMIAYHLPLNHPFAEVTDADGKFKIKDLPAGTYQFRVWHEKAGGGKGGFLESKLKVTVKPGDNEPVPIPADAAKFGL